MCRTCLLPLDAVELVEVPADEHAPDLAGAGADLVQLGVPQETTGRVVVDVTIAT